MFPRLPSLAILTSLVACLALPGCANEPAEGEKAESTDQDFSSRESVQLDFEFDGSLVSDSSFNPRQSIQDQFLYTIGHLNYDRSVGRLDRLVLTNIKSTAQAGGGFLVTYHAKMPVAWGRKTSVPATYSFTLPKAVSFSGLESFTSKYKESCVDFAAHEVTSGSMWYYYRPKTSGCSIDAADVITATATVTRSTENTTGKFPEYHKVWEDNELRVVSIFGKYEKSGTTSADAGISAYNQFVAQMRTTLGALSLTTEPASVPSQPGVAAPDVTFHATMADGKKITVNALLVDEISSAPESFYTRYESLSAAADVIAYNGHAGLGQNVRALANRGRFVPGKYLMLFMNGCDTFAYVDGSLAQKRAALNPDDVPGTKYMDIVTNAMPAFFHSDSPATTALITGLMSTSAPRSYEQIFGSIDVEQVVLVTGEEDNVFKPGDPIGPGGGGGGAWPGLNVSGSVARAVEQRWQTPELPAGAYTFSMTGTGDADLYVRRGSAPTTTSYDCRPYTSGSAETCTVTLAAPGPIHVMVRGYAAASTFALVGK
jgi:Bacterial pre-peptidase C-terminal domain